MRISLSSMTGFGRSEGSLGGRGWVWEMRSVNGRGLDLRMRLPSGFEPQEPALRQAASGMLKRGVVQATLSLGMDAAGGPIVRRDLLDQLMTLAIDLADRIPGALPPRAEALLALPGVLGGSVDKDTAPDPAVVEAVTAGFAAALQALVRSRRDEGARLAVVLDGQVDAIEAAVRQAGVAADEQVDAQRRRLQDTVRALLEETSVVGEDRLAQELALIASRSDVREELDRLASHIVEARALLGAAEPVGRRLDFLVQEFNREANTVCSKSATAALTTIGLRLKAVIEQLREQVQNIE